ncbi:hypothetical protein V6N11_078869 [Hibiscus sabdariffa]|uniref:Uncharacterized protein n=1 Tax=Hibiscus sabdariffa TaxID=183260 RepID=A0ABR2RTQ6_9ROSI
MGGQNGQKLMKTGRQRFGFLFESFIQDLRRAERPTGEWRTGSCSERRGASGSADGTLRRSGERTAAAREKGNLSPLFATSGATNRRVDDGIKNEKVSRVNDNTDRVMGEEYVIVVIETTGDPFLCPSEDPAVLLVRSNDEEFPSKKNLRMALGSLD